MSNIYQTVDLENIFSLAVEAHQNGNHEKAVDLYSHILSLMPDSPLVHYNKGLALYEQGNFSESLLCYKNALDLVPGEPDILYNMALCLKQLGKFQETIKCYEEIISANPDDIDSLYNLGCCYKDLQEDDKAIAIYDDVLKRDSGHQAALSNIAFLYHRTENYLQSAEYFYRLIILNPQHHAARHMLASLNEESPESAPTHYIEQVFDGYSERYENSLVDDLQYSVPLKMRYCFENYFADKKTGNIALDLGCGTGLGGAAFYDICSSIDGIDISKNMLSKAAQKNIYSTLSACEINDFLGTCNKHYNLILSTDVFIYLGDLEKTFTLSHIIAQKDCLFCFSTELLADHPTFALRKSGRFAHSKEYVSTICSKTGWQILESEAINLRKEKDEWIKGMLYFAKKT